MTKYVGIDLGTSNSAIACFDGDEVLLVTNSHGEISTPSVVRISDTGTTVGAKAKRYLHKDALNTHREFKRLMGTETRTPADVQGMSWRAEQLSAEVLKSLLSDVERQLGFKPDKAVITVPALFELPQSNATAEAGRIAGIEKVELLPEPVASALAAGWDASNESGAWLVFDLGGGTFDVSLLESRDGLLRVIAHDGDNFLGGRDIDRAIVEWVLENLSEAYSLKLDDKKESDAKLLNHLFQQVERAKIQLSRVEQTMIEIDFEWNDQELMKDIVIDRGQLEVLSKPVIDRALDICKQLLDQQGLSAEQLQSVVLVGGPAHMPIIQRRVSTELAAIAAADEDPMSLVAKGAALYSATVALSCAEPNEGVNTDQAIPPNIWLQYPSVCSELSPMVMGRKVENALDSGEKNIRYIRLERTDGNWQSGRLELDADGVFASAVQVVPGKSNNFSLLAEDSKGKPVATEPKTFTIVQGLTLSDPPLSRSIGVALATGKVKVFIERGTPLPAKRTFLQNTVETLSPKSGNALNIPIVQGERVRANYCRRVGNLVISSNDIDKPLNVGAAVEITIEVDKGGNMSASALLVDHNKTVAGVAELVMPSVEPDKLRVSAMKIQQALSSMQQDAFRSRDEALILRLDKLGKLLQECHVDLKNCDENPDLCMRLQRNLMEVEADIDELQSKDELEELLNECSAMFLNAQGWVEEYGNDPEKKLLVSYQKKISVAFERQRKEELQRLIEQLTELRHSAYRRSPEFWVNVFNYYASRVNEASNIKAATKLVQKGRALIAKGKNTQLNPVINELADLLPPDAAEREASFGSGVH